MKMDLDQLIERLSALRQEHGMMPVLLDGEFYTPIVIVGVYDRGCSYLPEGDMSKPAATFPPGQKVLILA